MVEDPYGTRDHTERMLAFLSPEALRVEGRKVFVRPTALRTDKSLRIPGDPSSAAFFAAAASTVVGSSITLRGVLLNPTRLGFFEILREMGARVSFARVGDSGGEPVGDITVTQAPLKAVKIAAERVPSFVDEVPLVAVAAATAAGETRLEGLGELRVKESDRLEGTAAGLRALGADAVIDGDALVVRGPAKLEGGAVETHGDHRLAMAFAIAALSASSDTVLSDGDCVGISYTGFFDDLGALCS